ncbi:glycosyltransferase [bacterium]|nr:glycosyltransferase [bacterium]
MAQKQSDILMPTLDTKLSVIIPVYKNSATISELTQRLQQTLEHMLTSYEIIFCVDACPENYSALIKVLAANNTQIKLLAHPTNLGQQRAIFTGLRAASGNIFAVMDADLQDRPEDLPTLLLELQTASAVFAGRRGQYESRFRLYTGKIFKTFLSWITGVPADAGAFVVFDKSIYDFLMIHAGEKPFLTAMIGLSKRPVTSIPIIRSKREHGESAYGAFRRLHLATNAIIYSLKYKLLK